jgi:hemerythrin
MAVFKWDNKYNVNSHEIDQQHKQLLELINELYEAMRSGQSSSIIGKIFTGMAQYAETHFATEEKLMIQYRFPGYAEHKIEHEAFIAKASDLFNGYPKTPTSITIETANFLYDWLQNHLLGTDKLYGPFLNEKGVY